MGRIVRRVAHRLVRGLIKARLLVVLVLGLGLVAAAVGAFQSFQAPSVGLGLPSMRRAPDAPESYLKGTQTFNAELLWNSLSDDALQRFQARGGTIQDWQRNLDVAKDKGPRIDQFNYVGGYPLPDGTSYQFYVATMRGGAASKSDADFVTYIFTLDRAGKISRIQ